MRFNELMTGIRQDVAVKIFGENLDSLSYYADKTSKAIQSVEGVTAPQVERVSGLPQINVEYDRIRMANYGLNIKDVNDMLSTAFAGKQLDKFSRMNDALIWLFDWIVRIEKALMTLTI